MYSTHQCVQYIPLCIIHTSWYSSYLCLQSKLVCTVHTLVYIKYRCKRQLFCKLKIVYKQQVLCIMYETALFVSNIICHHKYITQDYYDATGESLTKTSDQIIESAHQFVDKVIRRSSYALKDVTCKEHGEKMLQGM